MVRVFALIVVKMLVNVKREVFSVCTYNNTENLVVQDKEQEKKSGRFEFTFVSFNLKFILKFILKPCTTTQ